MNSPRIAGAAAAPLLAACTALLLAGCSDSLKQSFGLGKRAPDETRVVEQAPLELPPDFNLRPPSPGSARPQTVPASEQAAAALGIGADGEQPQGTPGESAFLGAAGAGEADPGIRAVLNRESTVLVADDPGFVERLMFWQEDAPEGVVIDPAGEAERLRANEAAGRAATEGATPVIVPRETAPLEGLNPF